MIGGIPKNLGQGARFNDSKYFVIEGDEYDTAFFDKRSKFVHYLPELLIVNNIEFDHADIFRDLDEIKLSFRRLLNIVPQNGMVLLNGDDPNCVEVARDCLAQIVEIGFSPNCAQQIRDVAYSAEGSRFTLGNDEFEVPLIGEFNVRNAAMAISAARFYGVSVAEDPEGARAFSRDRAPAGSAGRSARGDGDRRFRTSSDRDPRNAARAAAALSGLSFVGRLRAALEHDPPRGFSAGTARCAETGGRRFHFAGRAPRADPGRGAAESGSGRGRDRGVRPAGFLRAGCGAYCGAAGAAAEGARMSWRFSATAALTGSTGSLLETIARNHRAL